MNPEKPYIPTEKETAEAQENMSDYEKRLTARREKALQLGGEKALLYFAEELDYNDGVSGEAVELFRKELKEISGQVPKLEKAGYKVLVECSGTNDWGSTKVFLERNGKSVELFNQFYDSYSSTYDLKQEREREMNELNGRLDMAVKMAEFFTTDKKSEEENKPGEESREK